MKRQRAIGDELWTSLAIGVVANSTLEAGSDPGPRKETGFLVNKQRETPTNRACKTFIFFLPLPDFMSNGGGGEKKGIEEKELTK